MIKPSIQAKQRIYRSQQRQLWAVFGIVLLAFALDVAVDGDALIAKGALAGSLIAYVGQSVFAYLGFRTTSIRASRQMVQQMYQAQMLKWLITIAGFALVFWLAKPISIAAVFVGYLLMQLVNALSLWRFK